MIPYSLINYLKSLSSKLFYLETKQLINRAYILTSACLSLHIFLIVLSHLFKRLIYLFKFKPEGLKYFYWNYSLERNRITISIFKTNRYWNFGVDIVCQSHRRMATDPGKMIRLTCSAGMRGHFSFKWSDKWKKPLCFENLIDHNKLSFRVFL